MISARRTNDPAAAGFSLLEVIVAVAVLATGLVAVAQMFARPQGLERSAGDVIAEAVDGLLIAGDLYDFGDWLNHAGFVI